MPGPGTVILAMSCSPVAGLSNGGEDAGAKAEAVVRCSLVGNRRVLLHCVVSVYSGLQTVGDRAIAFGSSRLVQQSH